MLDKRIDSKDFIAQINDGCSILIGGWGPTRKPMTLLREIVKSKVKDLTILSFGGIDVDLLIGAGKVKKLIYPFVSLEGAPAKPANFQRARKAGEIEVMELSEYLFLAGLKATADRLPFWPARSGLGTDILTMNPEIETFEAPYTKEKLVAMPALQADIAIIHVNAADPSGYGQIVGDPLWDKLFVNAAEKVFLSAEKIVPLSKLKSDPKTIEITNFWVDGVIEAPYGAHPGGCYPDYVWDESHLKKYSAAAADPESFKAYIDQYVKNAEDQSAYIELVGGLKKMARLKG